MQIGLSQVLLARGIKPSAVIGHSIGEIAASVVAGCLTPTEGALVVMRRSKLYARQRGQELGGMALVNLPFASVVAELGPRKDLVAAIDSSPSTCVVSGEAGAVEKYLAGMKERSVKAFKVKTDIAFHSPVLEPLVVSLKTVLSGALHPRPASMPIFSTSNADPRTSVLRDTSYWVKNMVQPVHLRSAIEAAAEDGYRVFQEVSTHPIVTHSIIETLVEKSLDENEFGAIGTMKRDTGADHSIQQALARLYVLGVHVDFKEQLDNGWCKTVPKTPWVHKPYWKIVETGPLSVGLLHDVDKHTLLGQRTPVAGTDIVLYSTKLDDKTKPFPGTHPLVCQKTQNSFSVLVLKPLSVVISVRYRVHPSIKHSRN